MSGAAGSSGGSASASATPAAIALSEEEQELQELAASIKALQKETRALDIAAASGRSVDAGLHLQKKQLLLSFQIDQLAAKIRQVELQLKTAPTPVDKAALQADKSALQKEKILLLEAQQQQSSAAATSDLSATLAALALGQQQNQLASQQAISLGQRLLQGLQLLEARAADGQQTVSDTERGRNLLLNCNRPVEVVSDGPPLLAVSQLAQLHQRLGEGEEDSWVALVTPYLAAVVAEAAPSHVLANSELIQWIHTPAEDRNLYQKPDLFACHRAAFVSGSAPVLNSQSAESSRLAAALRERDFLFGSCAWPLRSAVLCLFEGKLEMRLEHDVGEVFLKVQNLLRLEPSHTQKRLPPCPIAKCCLFDKHRVAMLEFSFTGLFSRQECKWDDRGSRAALKRFLTPQHEPVWLRVLQGVREQAGVSIPPADAFLGHGATGLVFRVSASKEPKLRALKISIEPACVDSIVLEVRETSAMLAHSPMPKALQQVLPLKPSAAHVVLDDGARLGAGFVFGPVGATVATESRGAALWEEVLGALLLLHHAGLVHGDPRLPNLLRVPAPAGHEASRSRLVWIDFRQTGSCTAGDGSGSTAGLADDFCQCAASFFRLRKTEPDHQVALQQCARQYIEQLFAVSEVQSASSSGAGAARGQRPAVAQRTFTADAWAALSVLH